MYSTGRGATDIGQLRCRNEDAMLVDDQDGLYVVCDGLGGHAGGDVAAALAVDTVARHLRAHGLVLQHIRDGHYDERLLTTLAVEAVEAACREVFRHSEADVSLRGMGCTLTLLLVGQRRAAIAHVGDSRLYLIRNGQVAQLTKDHTLAAELKRIGIIADGEQTHPRFSNSLTRAVGLSETVEVERRLIELMPGDRFVLCSDGLSNYLDDPNRLEELIDAAELDQSATRLVKFANDRGGRDNITAVVVQIAPDAGRAACRSQHRWPRQQGDARH